MAQEIKTEDSRKNSPEYQEYLQDCATRAHRDRAQKDAILEALKEYR